MSEKIMSIRPARKRLTKKERFDIHQKTEGHCAYCGHTLPFNEMQVDHIVFIYSGGSDIVDNMLPACRSCNHYKSTMTLERFR